MTDRDAGILLREMLDSISIIQGHLNNVDEQGFLTHVVVQDAVIRRLEILGEIASRLPETLKDRFPSVDWRAITAMRNRLIHGYFTVDLSIVWNTVQTDMPILEQQARAMLSDVEQDAGS